MIITLYDREAGRFSSFEAFEGEYYWQEGNGSCDCNRAGKCNVELKTTSYCHGCERFVITHVDFLEVDFNTWNEGYNKMNDTEKGGISLMTGKSVKKPYMYEALTTVKDPASMAMCRVWRQESELPEYADEEVLAAFQMIPGGATMPVMINILSSLERVTRIEMTTPEGLGCTLHFKPEVEESKIERV